MLGISTALLGAILATIAALMFAFQYLFVRLATQEGTVTEVIFVTLLSNVLLLVPVTVVLYDFSMSLTGVLAFVAAGLAGSLFARICSFTSIKRIGASRTSPIVSSNALFATILAVVVLDETLTAIHFLGIVLIVAGVAVISYQTSESSDVDATRRELAILFVFPILAAVFLGIEPIFVSIGLDAGASIIPGTAIAVSSAFVGFTYYTWAKTGLPSTSLIGEEHFKWYVGAGIATTVGLLAAFTALETAPVVIAVPLIQTSPLLVLGLSAMFMSSKLERVTPTIVGSTMIIIAGAVIVSLSG